MTHEHDPSSQSSFDPAKRMEELRRRDAERRAAFDAEVAAAREAIRLQREACDTEDFEAVRRFLMQQSHALNSLFIRKLENAAGPRLDNEELSHILRTQRECRQTVLTLDRLNGEAGRIKKFSRKQTDSLDRLYNAGDGPAFDFSRDKPDGRP
jgi:hypothetical protein